MKARKSPQSREDFCKSGSSGFRDVPGCGEAQFLCGSGSSLQQKKIKIQEKKTADETKPKLFVTS